MRKLKHICLMLSLILPLFAGLSGLRHVKAADETFDTTVRLHKIVQGTGTGTGTGTTFDNDGLEISADKLSGWRPVKGVTFAYMSLDQFLDWEEGEATPHWKAGAEAITKYFSIIDDAANGQSEFVFNAKGYTYTNGIYQVDESNNNPVTNDQLLAAMTQLAEDNDSITLNETNPTDQDGMVEVTLPDELWLIVEKEKPSGITVDATPMLLMLPASDQDNIIFGGSNADEAHQYLHLYPKNFTQSTTLNKVIDPDGNGYVENDETVGVTRGEIFKWGLDIHIPATADSFEQYLLKDVLPYQVDLLQVRILALNADGTESNLLYDTGQRSRSDYAHNATEEGHDYLKGISGLGKTYTLTDQSDTTPLGKVIKSVVGKDSKYNRIARDDKGVFLDVDGNPFYDKDGNWAGKAPMINRVTETDDTNIAKWIDKISTDLDTEQSDINKDNTRDGWFEIDLQPALAYLAENRINDIRVEVSTLVNAAAHTGRITNEAKITDDMRTRYDIATTWSGGWGMVKTVGKADYNDDQIGVKNPLAGAEFYLQWPNAPAGIELVEGGQTKGGEMLVMARDYTKEDHALAWWTVKSSDHEQYYDYKYSQSDGWFGFSGLRGGTYEVMESKATSGYFQPDAPVLVFKIVSAYHAPKIVDGEVVSDWTDESSAGYIGTDENGVVIGNGYVTGVVNGLELNVINYHKLILPLTGGIGILAILLIGGLLMIRGLRKRHQRGISP